MGSDKKRKGRKWDQGVCEKSDPFFTVLSGHQNALVKQFIKYEEMMWRGLDHNLAMFPRELNAKSFC